jgi:hypothetical protein
MLRFQCDQKYSAGTALTLVTTKSLDSPLKWSKFGESREVPSICGYHRYSGAASAHRNQGVVRPSTLSDLLVTVLSGQAGE